MVVSVMAVLLATGGVQSAPYLYDMGAEGSERWAGFTPVTERSLYSEQAGFGWQRAEGLKASTRAYKEPVTSQSRGRPEPPPIWTNPITDGTITGDRENAFLIAAAPGDYTVYIVCGTSEPARDQYFDFTVRVGAQEQRVQVEGGYQFRALRFHA